MTEVADSVNAAVIAMEPLAYLAERRPLFDSRLHVGRPNVGNREQLMARIGDILERRWLTNDGPVVRELEDRLADLLGVKHCIAMCNATVGLEICTRALGMSGEVIVPSFTFVATAHALQWQEITPVFADIDPATHALDPASVARMITPRTTGIVGVHTWGKPCAVEALQGLADEHDLTLVFDAAHAFASSHGGQMIGGFGNAEVFSFHATKFFNTFEGGAVTTNDDALAAKLRLMKNFGFDGYDSVVYIGTNGKMSEVSAAMGLTSLDALDEFIGRNRANYLRYQQGLSGIDGVSVIEYDATERNNYQYVVAEIEADRFGMTRDTLIEVLHAENVLARRYFYPACHRMEPYRSLFPHAGLLLPETESLAERVISFPTGTALTENDVDAVCGIVRGAAARSVEVRAQYSRAPSERKMSDGGGEVNDP